jgi:hypothetical protein
LHTGECDCVGERVGGLAVEIAEQVASQCQSGEVLVSNTVKDLVAGSGIRFTERRANQVNENLGELRLFAVERGAAG